MAANGLVEQINRTLKQILSDVVSRGGKDWDDVLGPLMFVHHTACHSSTGEILFSLMYGHDACIPTS